MIKKGDAVILTAQERAMKGWKDDFNGIITGFKEEQEHPIAVFFPELGFTSFFKEDALIKMDEDLMI